MGVVQANNELKELQAKEEKEIDRVLRILSGECAAQRENILYDYDILRPSRWVMRASWSTLA